MKTLLLTICITSITIFCSSGDERKKKSEINANIREVYYIDKKSKLMDGGYFAIHTTNKDTLVEGNFKQGLRSGNWVFTDSKTNEKKLEYDFSANKLLFIEPKFYADSFLIQQGNEFVYDKVDRPLIFIGYDNELLIQIANRYKFTKEMYQNPCESSIIAFVVDENGNLAGSKIMNNCNSKVDQFINTTVNTFNGRLLPAIKNGHPVKSMFFVKAYFTRTTEIQNTSDVNPPYIFEINFHLAIETKRMTTVKRVPVGIRYKEIPLNNIH